MEIKLNSKFIYSFIWLVLLFPNIIIASSIFIFNENFDSLLGPILVITLFTFIFVYFEITHYKIKIIEDKLIITNLFFKSKTLDLKNNEVKLNTIRKDLFTNTIDLISNGKKYRFISKLSHNEKTISEILKKAVKN